MTGTRPSQAVRLRVEDLHDHPVRPKLMMPKSGKGGGRNRSREKAGALQRADHRALASQLRGGGRAAAGDAPLLLRSNGKPWGDNPASTITATSSEIVSGHRRRSRRVTMYALRHSSIVRMLLKNIPIRLIAALHDTSVSQIERNYSKHITEHSIDDITRAGLLSEPSLPPTTWCRMAR